MNPKYHHVSGVSGARDSAKGRLGREHLRRDESRPSKSTQPLPCWESRLAYVLTRYRATGAAHPLPHQWTTAGGQARCVRCGWRVESWALPATFAGFLVPICASKKDGTDICRPDIESALKAYGETP